MKPSAEHQQVTAWRKDLTRRKGSMVAQDAQVSKVDAITGGLPLP
jgi:hypothetical protein